MPRVGFTREIIIQCLDSYCPQFSPKRNEYCKQVMVSNSQVSPRLGALVLRVRV